MKINGNQTQITSINKQSSQQAFTAVKYGNLKGTNTFKKEIKKIGATDEWLEGLLDLSTKLQVRDKNLILDLGEIIIKSKTKINQMFLLRIENGDKRPNIIGIGHFKISSGDFLYTVKCNLANAIKKVVDQMNKI